MVNTILIRDIYVLMCVMYSICLGFNLALCLDNPSGEYKRLKRLTPFGKIVILIVFLPANIITGTAAFILCAMSKESWKQLKRLLNYIIYDRCRHIKEDRTIITYKNRRVERSNEDPGTYIGYDLITEECLQCGETLSEDYVISK